MLALRLGLWTTQLGDGLAHTLSLCLKLLQVSLKFNDALLACLEAPAEAGALPTGLAATATTVATTTFLMATTRAAFLMTMTSTAAGALVSVVAMTFAATASFTMTLLMMLAASAGAVGLVVAAALAASATSTPEMMTLVGHLKTSKIVRAVARGIARQRVRLVGSGCATCRTSPL